jgi:hypothetical protein
VQVIWSKQRYFCDEESPRKDFFDATAEVSRRARSTRRLWNGLVSVVITDSGPAAARGVSWRLVQPALNMAATRLPDVNGPRPRMLGIDEHQSARPVLP